MGEKVVVGMSGGVDSAAAALLLREQGLEVLGVTLFLWGEPTAPREAAALCRELGIPHRVLDLRERFLARVIAPFADEYTAGRTPNPCVLCNRQVKFAALWEEARRQGAAYLATGHYARAKEGRLFRGADAAKDQSYALWALPREWLGSLLLPLGEHTKAEIRALAAQAGLAVAQKAESQDICFVPDGDYGAFLERLRPGQNPAGVFVDAQGNPLGEHRGLWHYTVGQRKGLGKSFGRPMFVQGLDGATGNITLGDHDALYRKSLGVHQINWLDRDKLGATEEFDIKLRYSAPVAPGAVTPLPGGGAQVELAVAQRAVTPGQSAVFYRGEQLCGGGVIA